MAVALAQKSSLLGGLVVAAFAHIGIINLTVARRLDDAVPERRRVYVNLVKSRVSLRSGSYVAGSALARRRLAARSWGLRRAALFVFVVVCMVVCLNTVRVSFFGVRVLVTVSVRMSSGAVAVAYIMEQDQPDDVGSKTKRADDQNKLGLRDFLGFDKSLDGFEEDRETQGNQEDAVHKRTKRLCALPLYSINDVLAPAKFLYVLRRCTSLN